MATINNSYTDDVGQFEKSFRIRLREAGSASQRRAVVFQTSSDVSETRSVNYKTIDPIHAPGSIYAYQNTASRQYNMSGIKLFSRTAEEATLTLARLNLIRSWTMPTFGKFTTPQGFNGTNFNMAFNRANQDVLGSPPKILEFSAYSDITHRGNIYRIPTVITQLSIQYPTDVDYIPTAYVKGVNVEVDTPFPVLMTIDINLAETHSPVEYTNFSISDYRNGKLTGF